MMHGGRTEGGLHDGQEPWQEEHDTGTNGRKVERNERDQS